jgi:hypothetical protein
MPRNQQGASAIILSSALAILFAGVTAPGAPARAKSKPAPRVESVLTLETRALSFRLAPQDGSYQILDKQTNVVWRSNPYQRRFGQATLIMEGKKQPANLDRCEVKRVMDGLEATFRPLPAKPEVWLRIRIRALPDGKALEFSYAAAEALSVESVRILDDALWTTDTEKGYVVVTPRLGLLIPADSGLKFTKTYDTYAYEGSHMEMLGVVKSGATALITWDDPYVAAEVRSEMPQRAPVRGKQVLSTSLVLRKSAQAVQVRFTGRGDYVTIAKAYREVARQRGLLVPWAEKLKGNPERAKLFGAINFKLWALLDREMNEESTKEEVVKVVWTFDEAAQVAEHLKNDLQLGKVLFVMGGWTHRGYDNQHPDILPAAPECGGDEALARCTRRVMQLGYLLCLHDNYQDIYHDSPSWNENLIMKHPDGSLVKGGKWWGGRAYLTCSRQALELARRPQNLPAVKKLTEANSYFIDTTYAAGLQECFDPQHPLTRADDMRWKQALSDYARELFGIFGSEDGREWAIPHSDFFEGLTGVDGTYFHSVEEMKRVGGVSVPLFEIVYRDSIALYGKYGFDISKSAEYVLYHVSIGRPLNYHDVPAHLYWQEAAVAPSASIPTQPAGDPALFTRADHGWAEGLTPFDRFVKNTYEILSPLHELTAQMQLTQHQFLTPDRKIQRTVFGEGAGRVEVIVNQGSKNFRLQSKTGGAVLLPPYGFLIESPTFVAFHALAWNGLTYSSAPLFTLRSLDGKPLAQSAKIRVFHGFGEARLKLGPLTHTVEKETVLSHAAQKEKSAITTVRFIRDKEGVAVYE